MTLIDGVRSTLTEEFSIFANFRLPPCETRDLPNYITKIKKEFSYSANVVFIYLMKILYRGSLVLVE